MKTYVYIALAVLAIYWWQHRTPQPASTPAPGPAGLKALPGVLAPARAENILRARPPVPGHRPERFGSQFINKEQLFDFAASGFAPGGGEALGERPRRL
ncbi:MAG TPA: hypothetical protein VFA76_12970 [Terriglobales bacterium]|nr:hypothetical protein [Terriglobales bacterium]